MHINGATDSIQSIEQSFDTANQSEIWRLSGRVKFFQRFYKRFKLAATNSCPNSKFPRKIREVLKGFSKNYNSCIAHTPYDCKARRE